MESDTAPRSRKRWLLVAIPIVVVLIVGVVLWTRPKAKEASVDEASEQFRKGAGTTIGAAALLEPEAGVYRYEGTGTESISLLPTTQAWGPRLPVTITHAEPGCWTYRVEYSTNHWQETGFCAVDGVLEERTGRTFQRFDFGVKVEDTTEFVCTPPGQTIRLAAAPGDSWDQACQGHSPARNTNVTSGGTNTFVGREDLQIAGATVPTLHYKVARTLSGDQRGTEATEFWYDPATGQPLKVTRDVAVASPSPIGDVNYVEKGEYHLADRTPTR